MKNSIKYRIITFVLLILIGIFGVIIIPNIFRESILTPSLSTVGVAISVAGIVGLVREALIVPAISKEKKRENMDLINKIESSVSESLNFKIRCKYPNVVQVVENRREYPYYKFWMNEQVQTIDILGRSVLHSLERDLQGYLKQSAYSVIRSKLEQGARITIIFYNPQSQYIDIIAREEGRSKEVVLTDIARSIKFCTNLLPELVNIKFEVNTHESALVFGLFDKVQYLTYANFGFKNNEERTLIGFYLMESTGDKEPAFEVCWDETSNPRIYFGRYYEKIKTEMSFRNSWLIKFDHTNKPKLNVELYSQIYDFYNDKHPNIMRSVKLETCDVLKKYDDKI